MALTTFAVAPPKKVDRVDIEALHGLTLYAFTTDYAGAAKLIGGLIRASGLSIREVEEIAAANVTDLRTAHV